MTTNTNATAITALSQVTRLAKLLSRACNDLDEVSRHIDSARGDLPDGNTSCCDVESASDDVGSALNDAEHSLPDLDEATGLLTDIRNALEALAEDDGDALARAREEGYQACLTDTINTLQARRPPAVATETPAPAAEPAPSVDNLVAEISALLG